MLFINICISYYNWVPIYFTQHKYRNKNAHNFINLIINLFNGLY